MDPVLAQLPRRRLESRLGPETSPVTGLGLPMSGAGPDRRIALALCDAQAAGRSPLGRASGLVKEPSQTLEEILDMAHRHGWNHVFKTLKSQGLLEEQTLGQVVARWWTPRDRGAEAFTDAPRAGLRIAPSPAPNRIW
jgi:hypothetical protein